MPDEHWVASAVCAQVDPEVFTLSPHRKKFPEAKLICASCPVRTECLNDAMEMGEAAAREGVGGFAMFQAGLTPRELSATFKKSGRAARVKVEAIRFDEVQLLQELQADRFRSREEFWIFVGKEAGRAVHSNNKKVIRRALGYAGREILDELPNVSAERRSAMSSKLTAEDVLKIRRHWAEGTSAVQLGLMFGVGRVTAYQAATGATWAHLKEEEVA